MFLRDQAYQNVMRLRLNNPHQYAHEDARNHYVIGDTRYIALQLTLSGRSSGAEYTCYQSGHIPNHSTIADQLLPRKVPRSTNLSYSTLHRTISYQHSLPVHILYAFLLTIPFIPSLPRPSIRILSRRDRAPAPPRL